MTTQQRIDQNLAILTDKEPFFAETYEAARALLHHCYADNGGLHFAGGVCGPQGCTCGQPACLHRIAFRLYVGEQC